MTIRRRRRAAFFVGENAMFVLMVLGVLMGLALLLKGLRRPPYILHLVIMGAASAAAMHEYGNIQPFSDWAVRHALIWHLLSINLVTFLAYGLDKLRAKSGGWRIPERTLHTFALIGGTPAAFAGQRIFRHKTRKGSFQLMFVLVFCLQVVAFGAVLLLR